MHKFLYIVMGIHLHIWAPQTNEKTRDWPTNSKNLHVKKINSGLYREIICTWNCKSVKPVSMAAKIQHCRQGSANWNLWILQSPWEMNPWKLLGSSFPRELFLEAQFCAMDLVEISCWDNHHSSEAEPTGFPGSISGSGFLMQCKAPEIFPIKVW